MSYSPKQWKAINHYITKHNLTPELSAYPVVRFTDKKTGELSEIHINNIEDFYTADKERSKREAKENAKENKRQSKERKHGYSFDR